MNSGGKLTYQAFFAYTYGGSLHRGSSLVAPRLMAIAAVLASCAAAQHSVADISPVFARYGIGVVAGGTPTGDAELAAAIGSEVMASMGDIRSHVAMVRNDGPHTILDVIWIWTGITQDGRRVPMGGRTAVDPPDGIKPGDFFITGPSFQLTKILMHQAKQPRASLSGLPAAVTEVRNNLARYTTVEVSLDSVVLSNGILVGPDQYGRIESRRATNAAMVEIASRLNDPTTSDAQLNAWLSEVSKRPFTLKPNGLPDHSSVIGNPAQEIWRQMEQHGRAKMAEWLAEVTKKNTATKQLIHVRE